jgi:BirA family biotin operon repressor/biotin-[acetyl-CoA-carboxylase] ligase
MSAQGKAETDSASEKSGELKCQFDASAFSKQLKTVAVGRMFVGKGETGSTMDDVKQLIDEQKIPSGGMILAELQTKGRGREGRKWSSLAKGNLYFTFFLHVVQEDLPKIHFVVPLAVVAGCHAVGVSTAGIKWPNDVWVGFRKLCGMLFDVSSDPDTPHMHLANIGVGVSSFFTIHCL